MSTNYLTPPGLKKLREELHQLLSVERGQVVKAVTVAAAMGDRSENAEYIYGKRRLREIDSRIRFLQGRLDNVEVIDPEKVATDKVSFGAWVQVEDDAGHKVWYQIVGQDEIDPAIGRITFSSPVGRALLGKVVGAEVTVQKPSGPTEVVIVAITNRKP